VERRLVDWLKAEARRDLLAASSNYGRQMGMRWTRLTVRDTATRWGSCSAAGALSYSWRLVLAPPFVLDYVAAHEVAHLREMNHGRSFWGLVEAHCARAGEARRWLKAHGQGLHRYGAT
jgi:predicted metal-dependent hydrolase